MAYKTTIAPAVEVITLEEAKNQLQIDDFSIDDALINDLIKAVRQDVELYLNKRLITQTIEEFYKDYAEDVTFGHRLDLSLSPVQSVTAFTYADTTGNTQTLTGYQSDLVGLPCSLYPAVNGSFPEVQSGAVNPIKITYVVGYGDAATAVPYPIKQAMLLMIRSYYDNRHDAVRNMPTASKALLSKYRVKFY